MAGPSIDCPPAALYEIDYEDLEFFERCGGGAYGSVYRSKWKSQDFVVAVKKVLVLEKEAHVLSVLRHKNIIQFYGAVIKPPNYCLVTEYAPMGSLYAYLAAQHEDTPLDFDRMLSWIIDIGQGMNYLHTEAPVKVIHRDLKSKNVVIGSDHVCKICDFGASKFMSGTTKMSLAGTLPWMAPEVIQCHPSSEACDVWSFGVVVWELLTQEPPFKGIEGFRIAWLVVEKHERLTIPSTCPAILTKMMEMCWQYEPKERPTFPLIMQQLQSLRCHDSLRDISLNYLQNRGVWKQEIQNTMDYLKTMQNDLDQRQKELKEWEKQLEQKEQSLERQQYLQKLTSYDVNTWSEDDVYIWVKQLDGHNCKDLSKYADLFRQHNISGRRLLLLTLEDLRDMGIFSLGHRVEMQAEIERLNIHNKRMVEFPPLETMVLEKQCLPQGPKIVKLILLFGCHFRKGTSDKDHKWKMYMEVDENDNPAAIGCIKRVTFRYIDSEHIIENPPFVMEKWYTGISESSSVECLVTYQSHVKKPKLTKHVHRLHFNPCSIYQREVTLQLKQTQPKPRAINVRLSSSPAANSGHLMEPWRSRAMISATPASPSSRKPGLWASIVAGRRFSPAASPSARRKISLPTTLERKSKGNTTKFYRTVSNPMQSPLQQPPPTPYESNSYSAVARRSHPPATPTTTKKVISASPKPDVRCVKIVPPSNSDSSSVCSGTGSTTSSISSNDIENCHSLKASDNMTGGTVTEHKLTVRPRFNKSTSDSGIQVSPETQVSPIVPEYPVPASPSPGKPVMHRCQRFIKRMVSHCNLDTNVGITESLSLSIQLPRNEWVFNQQAEVSPSTTSDGLDSIQSQTTPKHRKNKHKKIFHHHRKKASNLPLPLTNINCASIERVTRGLENMLLRPGECSDLNCVVQTDSSRTTDESLSGNNDQASNSDNVGNWSSQSLQLGDTRLQQPPLSRSRGRGIGIGGFNRAMKAKAWNVLQRSQKS